MSKNLAAELFGNVEGIVYLTAAIALANIVFIYLYYLQLRQATRACIYLKVVGEGKNAESKSSVLEQAPKYLVLTNSSREIIKKIKLKMILKFDTKSIEIPKVISYLNPGESVSILIELNKIIECYPELFDEETLNESRGEVILKIPRETLHIDLDIDLTWEWLYRLKDSFKLDWGSLQEYPDMAHHPIILSWNKRDGEYIHKIKDWHLRQQ